MMSRTRCQLRHLGERRQPGATQPDLLELAGDTPTAIVEFQAAAARAVNVREQHYLTTKAARLSNRARARLIAPVRGVWGGSAKPNGAVRREDPAGIVGDLPGMPVEIDEHPRVSAPERLGSRPADG